MLELTQLLDRACTRDLGYEEFLQQARQHPLRPEWLLEQLRRVDANWDDTRIALLGDCLYLARAQGESGWQPVTSEFCRLLCDPRMEAGTVESIADGLGCLPLAGSDLGWLVKVCTLTRWTEEGFWPDLRKALEAMLDIYRIGGCSKAQLVEALRQINTSPATQSEDCGLRATAQAMITQVEHEANR